MNNITIKTAIAAVAAASSAHVFSAILTHDFYTAAGDQQMHYVLTSGALYQASVGSAADSVIVENQVLRIHYRDSAGEGLKNRSLQCSGVDGDNTEGGVESWRADQIHTYFLGVEQPNTVPEGKNAFTCDIAIGPQGEVLGGWNTNLPATFDGTKYTSFTLLSSPRRNIAYSGTTCDGVGAVDINTAFATNALYDKLIRENGSVAPNELDNHINAPSKPAGCTTYGISRVAIGQCDPVEAEAGICLANGAKSVPVPAFAAAALSLGLIGITYLTGRRRTIG